MTWVDRTLNNSTTTLNNFINYFGTAAGNSGTFSLGGSGGGGATVLGSGRCK